MSDFIFARRETIEYLEVCPFKEFDFLLHAFLTRRGGMSEGNFADLNLSSTTGDKVANVQRNWRLLAESFRVDLKRFIAMQQTHGDRIVVIEDDRGKAKLADPDCPREYENCDALVTNRMGLAIGVKTADCVPLFLVDPVRRVIGAVHAGWRGTALDIAGQVVDVLVERYSSKPADILVAIGPSIGACCYEVDAAVYAGLSIYGEPGRKPAFRPTAEVGKWMLDLGLINRYQVEKRGIDPEHIFTGDYCTSCHRDSFYSHRRDCGQTGRHFSFLMMKA